jgi:hypothetical protein
MLHAGAGAVTITPPLGLALAGLFESRRAETVVDDLFARALVLDDGKSRLALVICDLIAIGRETVCAARDLIGTRYGIPSYRIMISCTHTHTGPATIPLLASEPDRDYLDWLSGRIADAVGIACSRLQPARIASGTADVDAVCFNRRFRMRDGTVVFNPGVGNPDIMESVGPTDPQVTALLIEDASGIPIALWANLSLHYVGTDDPLAVSADYYGQFAQAVATMRGPACIGLLTNGTSGDINNVDVNRDGDHIPASAQARRVAVTVASAAIAATAMQRRDQQPLLDARTAPFTVFRRPITEGDVSLAEAIVAEPDGIGDAPASTFSFVVGQPIPDHQVPTYANEVLEVSRMPDARMTELQVMRIGDVVLVAFPGEVFVKLGLAIKAESPFPRTAIVSLANDYIGYVPTEEAFAQGGYETWAARSAWSAPGTGEGMVREALAQLRNLERARGSA